MAHNFVWLYLVDGHLEVDLAQVGALAPVHDAHLSGRDVNIWFLYLVLT